MPAMPPPMGDSHRQFLQCFMSRGVMIGKEVKKQYKIACTRAGETGDEKNLVDFVSTINANIKSIHLEIRKVLRETDGANCYGLITTNESDITKLATDYNRYELDYFKRLLENIVESDDGTCSSMDALHLRPPEKKMTKEEVQELLIRMVRDLWLEKLPSGEYCLSPRSILELEQYIFEQFPDYAVKCNMCKRLCLQGQVCGSCDTKLHMYCAQRYFHRQSDIRCPSSDCGAPWPHTVPTPTKHKEGSSSQPGPSSSQLLPSQDMETDSNTHSTQRPSRKRKPPR